MAKQFKPCSVVGCNRDASAKGGKHGYCRPHHDRLRMYGDPLGGRTPNGDSIRWLKDNSTFRGDECLSWPFGRHTSGYGVIGQKYAHRLMCELAHGPSPSPLHNAAHSCGKGEDGCVSPSHLRWATPSENSADMVEHGTVVRGEISNLAKLTTEDVLRMRAMKGLMLQKDIAAHFGVDPTTVSNIFTGKNWGWLG